MKKYLLLFLFFPFSLYAQLFGGFRTIIVTAASSGWTDTGTEIEETTTTDEVIIGGTATIGGAKLTIDGDGNQTQFLIQENSSQTGTVMEIEDSDGTDLVIFYGADNGGTTTFVRGVQVGSEAGQAQKALVVRTISGTDGLQVCNNNTGNTLTDGFQIELPNAANSSATLNNYENAGILFRTNDTQRLEIENDGDYGFNTIEPVATSLTLKSKPFFLTYEGIPAGTDSSIEIDIESGNAIIRGNSAAGGSSDIAWQGDSLNFSFASNGYKFKSGDIFYGTDVVLVNNAVSAGSNAFTTTATTDTVIVSGSATTDLYWIQLTGTGAPGATDAHKVEARSGSFVVHRGAAGTSGLTYNWKREKP